MTKEKKDFTTKCPKCGSRKYNLSVSGAVCPDCGFKEKADIYLTMPKQPKKIKAWAVLVPRFSDRKLGIFKNSGAEGYKWARIFRTKKQAKEEYPSLDDKICKEIKPCEIILK